MALTAADLFEPSLAQPGYLYKGLNLLSCL